MSKTKTSSKAAAPSKSANLKKVKEGGVTKPAQTVKSKTKEIAKNVASKEEKKSKKDKKKVVKEPTPEPSSSEEEEDSSESESSESEVEVKKAAVNGKAKNTKKPAQKEDSSDSESDSTSEDEAPAPKKVAAKSNGTNGVKVAAKKEESSDSESDSDASSDDEAPAAVLGVAPPVDQAAEDSSDESESSDDEEEAAPKTNGAAKADVTEDSDDSDADSSSDSESETEKEEPAAKVNKRKAEEQPERAIKKAKAEAESAAPSANPASTNLFVGNLSWNVDDELLRSTFEEYGELTRVQVMYDRNTQRAKGFGYVEFAKAEDAAAAYEAKKGFELDGRAMNVDYSSRKPADGQRQEDRRKSFGDQLSPPTATLFVGNIAFDAGQEQISEAFAPYGTILSVRIPTDQESGQMKGFGYVTYSSVDEATAAINEMQGAYISNRPIRLDYGTERADRGDGGSGGRGRGRGDFGGRGGRGRGGDRGRGGRGGGRGFGDRGGRGRGGFSTNRGGFGDFSGRKQTFD